MLIEFERNDSKWIQVDFRKGITFRGVKFHSPARIGE